MANIDFQKTSNSCISIKEMFCHSCNGSFYELEDHELDQCPLCEAEFDDIEHIEPSENASDDETWTLIVDHKTGRPSIIKNT